ncbi:MAG TPA: helix-turn-helix domain-containing protein [Thiobacillus sp.]
MNDINIDFLWKAFAEKRGIAAHGPRNAVLAEAFYAGAHAVLTKLHSAAESIADAPDKESGTATPLSLPQHGMAKRDDREIVSGRDNGERLTTEQAAEYLGVKPSTLETWRCNKRYGLAYIKLGRLIRYRVRDLDAFLERRTRQDDA